MSTKETNQFRINPRPGTTRLPPYVSVSWVKRPSFVPNSDINQYRLDENQLPYSCHNMGQLYSTVHEIRQSDNPMMTPPYSMNTYTQRHLITQPLITQNSIKRPRFLLTPKISPSTSLSSTDNNGIFQQSSTSFQGTIFSRSYDQSVDHHKKKTRRRNRLCGNNGSCCSCSVLKMLLTILCLMILAIAIALLIMGILMSLNRTTTTTTEISSSSTSTATTITSTTISTSISTTTTSTTTTTTTSYLCGATCLNQTWQSSSNLLAKWLFDGNFNDEKTSYNATPSNNVSFTTQGYVKEGAVFLNSANQMLTVATMPLSSTSFTIETWLYITGFRNINDHSIFGYCTAASSYQCLHLTIRQSSSNYYLYLGFYSGDCQGNTPLTAYVWIHAGFVFDMTNMKQFVYLNGILDRNCSVTSAVNINPSSVTIGYIPVIAPTSPNNYFQGYMDQLTVSLRAKSSCEILEDATLSAYFTFDSASLLIDSGPNSLQATTQSTSVTSSGHIGQALSFSGTSSSYFQINDLTTLGISNRSFSISFWIRPSALTGVLVHVSSNATGLGSCLPLIGFATNGSLVAQIINSNGIYSVLSSSVSVQTSTWSHVVQTWSSTNGLRLYIDNILQSSMISSSTAYAASGVSNYLTLGNSLSGNGICASGQIGALTPYQGDIDDFRVYSRELDSTDICKLYTG